MYLIISMKITPSSVSVLCCHLGVAVSRVLMDRQTTEALRVAFSNVFSSETARFPSFENGKSLQGITVDFSDAESRALHEVLGKNLAPNLLRECKVRLTYTFGDG